VFAEGVAAPGSSARKAGVLSHSNPVGLLAACGLRIWLGSGHILVDADDDELCTVVIEKRRDRLVRSGVP
jgi:hypothetical protein